VGSISNADPTCGTTDGVDTPHCLALAFLRCPRRLPPETLTQRLSPPKALEEGPPLPAFFGRHPPEPPSFEPLPLSRQSTPCLALCLALAQPFPGRPVVEAVGRSVALATAGATPATKRLVGRKHPRPVVADQPAPAVLARPIADMAEAGADGPGRTSGAFPANLQTEPRRGSREEVS